MKVFTLKQSAKRRERVRAMGSNSAHSQSEREWKTHKTIVGDQEAGLNLEEEKGEEEEEADTRRQKHWKSNFKKENEGKNGWEMRHDQGQ